MAESSTRNNEKPTKPPYFTVYPRDEMSDYRMRLLDLESFGLLQKMKYQLWTDEKLPLNFKDLAKLFQISAKKIEKLWKNINYFFIVEGESEKFIRHFELDIQRAKYNDFIDQRRIAGQISAEKRANNRPTPVEHPFNKSESESQSSSESKSEERVRLSHTENDAGASESESEPIFFDDCKNYVFALKDAGKEIADTNAYASKLFKDLVAHHSVRRWKKTGNVDYQKPESLKSRSERMRESVERAKAKV